MWLSNMPVLVDACIDSAIKIIDLFKVFLRNKNHPKRMPLVVNATFICSLVLGTACFADIDSKFSVAKCLDEAYTLFVYLGQYDTLAMAMKNIVGHLKAAARAYIEARAARKHGASVQKVAELFGALGEQSPLTNDPLVTPDNVNNERQSQLRQLHSDQLQIPRNSNIPPSTEEAPITDGIDRLDESLRHFRPHPDELVQEAPDLTWLDSTQTFHFGSYEETSAFFSVMDQNYFSQG
jgi:hypothetical protein